MLAWPMRHWGIAAYITFLLERLSQAVQVFPRPSPAQFRKYDQVRPVVRLEQPYYAAKGQHGFVLVPNDSYTQEAEAILDSASQRV